MDPPTGAGSASATAPDGILETCCKTRCESEDAFDEFESALSRIFPAKANEGYSSIDPRSFAPWVFARPAVHQETPAPQIPPTKSPIISSSVEKLNRRYQAVLRLRVKNHSNSGPNYGPKNTTPEPVSSQDTVSLSEIFKPDAVVSNQTVPEDQSIPPPDNTPYPPTPQSLKPRTPLPFGKPGVAEPETTEPANPKRPAAKRTATNPPAVKQPAAKRPRRRESTKLPVGQEESQGEEKPSAEESEGPPITKRPAKKRPAINGFRARLPTDPIGGIFVRAKLNSPLEESEGSPEPITQPEAQSPTKRQSDKQQVLQEEQPIEGKSPAEGPDHSPTTKKLSNALTLFVSRASAAKVPTMVSPKVKKTPAKGNKKRAAATPNGRSVKKSKKDVFDDPEALMEDPFSVIYAPETNLKAILQHPLAKSVLENSPLGNQLSTASSDELASAVALFKEDGRSGRYDPEWLQQAAVASERRAAGEFEAYQDAKFKEDWCVEGEAEEYSDEEDECGTDMLGGNGKGKDEYERMDGDKEDSAATKQAEDSRVAADDTHQSNGDGDATPQSTHTESFGVREILSPLDG